jgi:hypothetical protein
LICADDAEAIEMAKKLVIDRDVELWQLDRKIGTFNHPPRQEEASTLRDAGDSL